MNNKLPCVLADVAASMRVDQQVATSGFIPPESEAAMAMCGVGQILQLYMWGYGQKTCANYNEGGLLPPITACSCFFSWTCVQ
eukprot:1147420-Pelagomonas_calceolata.AAC.4